MKLPLHKTKIVCTIGPACRSLSSIENMVKSGMNVARLNFSHGNFHEHTDEILNIRKVSEKLKMPVSIIIDLPGVKMRIGNLKEKSLVLKKGETATLTTRNILGTIAGISVSYKRLPESVSKGSIIYLSDGFIQLKVKEVAGTEIHCEVLIGGVLLSHKGINLPGAKMFVNPVTAADLAAVEYGLQNGVNIFGLSFVERAADIKKVRNFAKKMGKSVYIVAKIERREAVENYDEILKEADAIMVARGDLGIEVPLEEVPVIQKNLIRKANLMGRPVITATQMLGSMTQNVRPTRAEVNDVANAILDGTDAVMLSEETAIGEYPLEAVKMMSKIALSTEGLCHSEDLSDEFDDQTTNRPKTRSSCIPDVISLNAVRAAEELKAKFILSPTSSGNTVRRICRFKPPCWILSFSTQKETCELLNFSYGVYPFLIHNIADKSKDGILKIIRNGQLVKNGDTVVITERRLSPHAGETDSLGIVTLE
ncbi:MAG: pyruvate kinase [Candidatus Omnitrophica bacterium]|nr:pyruvate kinase [Candidatus Omnitrophota bacterium]